MDIRRARTIHDQIKYEAEEEANADAALKHIEALEKWIKGFNSPRFTHRHLEPSSSLPPETIDSIHLLFALSGPFGFGIEGARRDPRFIDTSLTEPVFDLLKQRAQFRMKVARKEKRYTLAGAKRETGGALTEDQHAAAARYGSGEMGRQMFSRMSMYALGWDPKKPTAYQLKMLANIAQKLFDLDEGYSPQNMRHYIATAIEINDSRGEEGFWFRDP